MTILAIAGAVAAVTLAAAVVAAGVTTTPMNAPPMQLTGMPTGTVSEEHVVRFAEDEKPGPQGGDTGDVEARWEPAWGVVSTIN